jgi:hypothetical protein
MFLGSNSILEGFRGQVIKARTNTSAVEKTEPELDPVTDISVNHLEQNSTDLTPNVVMR